MELVGFSTRMLAQFAKVAASSLSSNTLGQVLRVADLCFCLAASGMAPRFFLTPTHTTLSAQPLRPSVHQLPTLIKLTGDEAECGSRGWGIGMG